MAHPDVRVLAAQTSFPNTFETDLLSEVLHDVEVMLPKSGKKFVVRIMAACPMTAMEKVAHMSEENIRALGQATAND
jgi:hypothetical protein